MENPIDKIAILLAVYETYDGIEEVVLECYKEIKDAEQTRKIMLEVRPKSNLIIREYKLM